MWPILVIRRIFYDFDAPQALETQTFGGQVSMKGNAIYWELIFERINVSPRCEHNFWGSES